jgi:hypothetical protein
MRNPGQFLWTTTSQFFLTYSGLMFLGGGGVQFDLFVPVMEMHRGHMTGPHHTHATHTHSRTQTHDACRMPLRYETHTLTLHVPRRCKRQARTGKCEKWGRVVFHNVQREIQVDERGLVAAAARSGEVGGEADLFRIFDFGGG